MRIRSRKSRIEGEIIVEEPFYEKYCAAEIIGHIPGHFPLKDLAQRSGTVAAMFRDPRRRLVSAFNHHRHAFGMNGAVSEQMRATTHTVEAYANFPGIQKYVVPSEEQKKRILHTILPSLHSNCHGWNQNMRPACFLFRD